MLMFSNTLCFRIGKLSENTEGSRHASGMVHHGGPAWRSGLAGICGLWLSVFPSLSQAAVVPAISPTRADVDAAYTACVDGDTLSIPAGAATWTSGLAITKRIRVQGQGSGRVIARSTDTVTVGTGTKTFVLIPLPASSTPAFMAGQVLRVERTGNPHSDGNPTGTRASMTGTVTNYTGSTLTLNVTSTTGFGTHPLWIVSTAATTTITQGFSGDLLSITENTTGSIEVGGIRFVNGSGGKVIRIYITSSGRACLIHDCYFEQVGDATSIYANTNRGVIWELVLSLIPLHQSPTGRPPRL